MAMNSRERRQERPTQRLRWNAIGLVAAATIGIVYMSPALAFYGNWGPAATISGGPAPFIFLIGALVVLPTALSYAFVARRLPAAGSAYTWVGREVNRHVGNWLGWMMLPYYVFVMVAPAALFGLFFNALLNQVGLDIGLTDYGTFVAGALAAYAIATVLAFAGIETASKAATVIVSFEVAVIVALATTILVEKVGDVSGRPFDPTSGTITAHAFWLAMPIAFFSFLGFDVVSTVAEETKLARRAIPAATMLAVLLFTAYILYATWTFSFAVPFKQLDDLIASGITPVTPIATRYWGSADVIVSITGLTAGLGASLAILVGAGRIMFAMARDNALPSPLARLHPRFRSPWAAMGVVLLIGVPYDLIAGWKIGALNAYIWAGVATVFFALVTYIFVNVGNFALNWRHHRSEFNWWWHGVVPLCGAVFSGAVAYKGILESYWNAGWVTLGRGIVVFCIVWFAVGFLYAYVVRNRARVPRIEPIEEPGPEAAGR